MATLTIDGINRKTVTTKYGEREGVGVLPLETTVTDVNGDEIELNGRWLNGFKDKAGETDEWVSGMKIKVQVVEKEYTSKDGEQKKALNFRVPDGQSSIVERPSEEPNDDF